MFKDFIEFLLWEIEGSPTMRCVRQTLANFADCERYLMMDDNDGDGQLAAASAQSWSV